MADSDRPTLPDLQPPPLTPKSGGEYRLQFDSMTARLAQLEAQVRSLADRVAELSARLPPKPAKQQPVPVVAREVILPPGNDRRREE